MSSSASVIEATAIKARNVSCVFIGCCLLNVVLSADLGPHSASTECGQSFSTSVNVRQIQHGPAEQSVNRVFLPGLHFDEMRPILVGLRLVARHVLCPKLGSALRVLDDELAGHDGPKQRVGGTHFADTCGIAAEATVGGRI